MRFLQRLHSLRLPKTKVEIFSNLSYIILYSNLTENISLICSEKSIQHTIWFIFSATRPWLSFRKNRGKHGSIKRPIFQWFNFPVTENKNQTKVIWGHQDKNMHLAAYPIYRDNNLEISDNRKCNSKLWFYQKYIFNPLGKLQFLLKMLLETLLLSNYENESK